MIGQHHKSARIQIVVPILVVCGLAVGGLSNAVGLSQSEPTDRNDGLNGPVDAKVLAQNDQQIKQGKLYMGGTLKLKSTRGQTKEVRGIIEVDSETGAWRKLVGRGDSPRISPDGKTMIYCNEESTWSCDLERPLSPRKITDVSGTLCWSQDGHLNSPDHAAWSPDCKQIAVITFDWSVDKNGTEFISDPEDAHYRIEILSADGSNRRVIELKDATVVWLGSSIDWK